MRLTVLRNDATVPPGHVIHVASARSIDTDLVRLDAGDPLPDLATVDAVVVLGGEMGAYDTRAYPYLAAEKAFLAEAVERGVPVLGLCLGCQLLADALGGRAYLADAPEVSFAPIDLVTPDTVVQTLADGPCLLIHRDTWDLPPGGRIIAATTTHNHAFRFGSALGVQPHPEVEGDVAASWVASTETSDILEGAGVDRAALLASLDAGAVGIAATADRFFGAWFDEAERLIENARRR